MGGCGRLRGWGDPGVSGVLRLGGAVRSRNIKPGFFKNEVLATLPLEARFVFIGLWCLADREGRLEDRPQRIGIEIFPYEKVDIEMSLHVLSESKPPFIVRYESKQKRYIQIINFNRHQHVHPHEKQSEIVKCNYITRNVALNPSSLNPESLSQRFARWWATYPKKSEALR